MSESLVSVIVPVFKVEKYLRRCVNSLLHQDYQNIEIILVDDGSPDSSGSIIDTFALQDSRVVPLHQDNSGVSRARNNGIKASHGKWVMFVDGDDWVDSNYVSYFVSLVENNKSKVGFNTSYYSITKNASHDNMYIVPSEKAQEMIFLEEVFVAVWNKIYDTDVLKTKQIAFHPDIWYGEGMLFNIEYLQHVSNVAIGGKAVYHQEFNPDSAMRSFNLKSNICGLRSMDLQRQILKNPSKRLLNAWAYHKYCFNRTIINGLYRTNAVNENHEIYDKCAKNIRNQLYIPLRIEKNPRKLLGWIVYGLKPDYMAERAKREFMKLAKISRGGGTK